MSFPLKILKLPPQKIREMAKRQLGLSEHYKEKSLDLLEDSNRLIALANEKEEIK